MIDPAALEKALDLRREHTRGCQTVGLHKRMGDLDILLQEYILLCPNETHDSVRQMFGFKRKLENGKLIRI